jgi:glutamate synthase (NADPH/NADH) small chain
VKIPRQPAIELPPLERVASFLEVSAGFDEARALTEARRCLDCRKPVCVDGCPVGVDIPGFIRLLLARDYASAARKIRETNFLPAICGRVCPQESQCEAVCTVGRKFAPVAIGRLERFVADHDTAEEVDQPPSARRNERVAVVGSGPAGLTCAAELARLGYRVTIFEALHALGGVLRYGIPEFRLPREILDVEIERVQALGVEIRTNFLVGRTATLDELLEDPEWGYSAVFLASGAGTPTFLGIPGEGLSGVYSANEFLTRVNLMRAHLFPDYDTPVKIGREVAVVGGGNTAMDAVRTARRLGAERAYLVYRRSRQEMPARDEEVHHAEEEGVEFLFLTNPIRVLGSEDHWVTGLECQRMELGEPDGTGRRRPVPIPGSEWVLPVQTVIEAVGQRPNTVIQSTSRGLEVGRAGTVVVDDEQRTSRPGVFAGGDLARGGATVILAMRDGRRAAAAIHAYLTSTAAGRVSAEQGDLAGSLR